MKHRQHLLTFYFLLCVSGGVLLSFLFFPGKQSQAQRSGGSGAYTPSQIKAAYHLPASGGRGTIAIIDMDDTPNLQSDLDQFDNQFGLPACNAQNGCLTIYPMGGSRLPAPAQAYELETDMDVEWAHAIAPNAKILLVEATDISTQSLADAISYAASQPGVVSVSMSFGADESMVAPADDATLFVNPQHIGYFAASGDQGSAVNWPAVAPNVIGVGGTSLQLSGNSVTSETAWGGGFEGTGGGLSQTRQEPSYQTTFGVPQANSGRAVPDVSAIADNHPGAIVIFQGMPINAGGTSLGTPIWAGMNALGTTTITHDMLYQNAKTNYAAYFRDITQGTNGSCGFYCTAQVGYDYLTGLGSPVALPPTGTSAPAPTTSSPGTSGSSSPTPLPPSPTAAYTTPIYNCLGSCPTSPPASQPPALQQTGPIIHDANSTSTSNGNTVTTLAWNHTTTAQNNRILLVGITLHNNNSVSSVTYNGKPLAKINAVNCANWPNDVPGRNDISDCRVELWYTVNPASGTHPITVSTTATDALYAGATTFYNINQQNPFTQATTAIVPAVKVAVASCRPENCDTNFVPSHPNQMVFDTLAGEGYLDAPTFEDPQTLAWDTNPSQDVYSTTTGWFSAGSYQPGTGNYIGGTTRMAWVFNQYEFLGDVAVALNPAVATAPVGPAQPSSAVPSSVISQMQVPTVSTPNPCSTSLRIGQSVTAQKHQRLSRHKHKQNNGGMGGLLTDLLNLLQQLINLLLQLLNGQNVPVPQPTPCPSPTQASATLAPTLTLPTATLSPLSPTQTMVPSISQTPTPSPYPTSITPPVSVYPPFGTSSGGSGGGAAAVGVLQTTSTGIQYYLISPTPKSKMPLLIVYSGNGGAQQMATQFLNYEPSLSEYVIAVIDGVIYNGNGSAGADVLDDVRKHYDIDNDRTFLMGESAGTTAALQLGLQLRQSYFAGVYFNDIIASYITPKENASTLHFAPYGGAAPGGDFADANAIVSAMTAAGYRTQGQPYNGPGAGTHASGEQFNAAFNWLTGKSRL